MTKVQITLPDQLAQDAQQAGLLSSPRLEQWLREQLDSRRVDELFAGADRMAGADGPAAMSPEEVAAEIATMRVERRAKSAG
jgi:Arc/MetJ family transcription regulator